MKIIIKSKESEARKKRIAAYCRVSTLLEAQDESLETQTAYYRNYIEANPDWKFAGVYSDRKTGTDAKRREGFQKMIDKACNGKIDTIITKSVSRFSRNLVNTLHYVEVLKSHGVNVIFEKEGIDSASPSSSLVFSFLAAIAQNESQSISANIRNATRKRYARGEYSAGSHQCFGYKAVDGKLVPDEDADIVRAIYSMYLEGLTCAEIAQKLRDLGVIGRTGQPISMAGISYILRNESYIGDKKLLKSARKELFSGADCENETFYLENDHEPIIERDVWEEVQKRLDAKGMIGRKNIRRGGGKTHFLHDKMVCGCCGESMTRRTLTGYNQAKYKAWECLGHHKGKKGNGCTQRVVKEEKVLKAIENAIGTAVDERSIAAVERVVVIEQEITVEKA